jgi:FKBP-type peptidyl-prolyl cis-trans isomerase
VSKRSTALLLVAVALAAGLTLSACGQKAAEQPAEPSVQAEQPATDQTQATEGSATAGQPATTPQVTELKKEDLVVGKGTAAKAGDNVTVHYTLWLDGQKLESSKDSGQPFPFNLGAGEVIPGWDQGVAGMKVGGTRKLTIPPDLAYGAQGSGPIPPNSTLVFEVELLKIN